MERVEKVVMKERASTANNVLATIDFLTLLDGRDNGRKSAYNYLILLSKADSSRHRIRFSRSQICFLLS